MADREGGNRKYWLMKAEGESRIVKGIDVAFTFEMLEKITKEGKMESWSGVRNYEARNMIRDQMSIGDYAFLYCSNCKFPHIRGVMEICSEPHPDDSCWDPNDPYYDPKSTKEKPRWYSVGVQSRYPFKRPVTLRELKMHINGKLSHMSLLNRARLSISKVNKDEWDFIHQLAELPEPSEVQEAREKENQKETKKRERRVDDDGKEDNKQKKSKSPYIAAAGDDDTSLNAIKQSRIKECNIK
ncbi:DUF55 family protein [Schizosaccharomyces cryophilus OY26]|uniref:DUF55 family protein n=1 Tax=Schizosaccharomyces cryophilus (strain OY26 / ATCC MYA-4695 / CBS 11777 / NBRC 106824 / NRRL Y48691) TaxID=653667 RepID=S9XAB3_SCHCR|nr:DUF55 family protein [Schizosaccharomyces cryophilus OY26]EPY50711.1 DUF55 family protein [Schizosaccharomyces cryophilus OY26]